MSGGRLLGVRAGSDDRVDIVGGHGVAGIDELLLRVRARDTAAQAGAYSNVASATTAAAPPPPSGNLVAAYAFDEGSGTSVGDLSGNGNTGTVQDSVLDDIRKVRQRALRSTARAQECRCPDAASLDLTSGMTLEAWVNPTASQTGWRTVVLEAG